MMRCLALSACALTLLLAGLAGAYPKPSPYPIAWQLRFDHETPRRIVVGEPGSPEVQAYWYMRYAVTNLSGSEQHFLPVFQMLLDDGRLLRSDEGVSDAVLREIRAAEKNRDLLSVHQIAGTVRVGIDQAREGIAVWREPKVRMGRFTIFVGGLSGEATILTDDQGRQVTQPDKDGKPAPVVLWKTFAMEYIMLGDELYPGRDPVELIHEEWVMR
jgi:hypothetical protein